METMTAYRAQRLWRTAQWAAQTRTGQIAVPLALAGTAAVAGTYPDAVAQVASVSLGVGTGLSGWAGWAYTDAAFNWRHRRTLIVPLGKKLRPILGYPDDYPAVKWIQWDPNFGEEAGTSIRVMLPEHFIDTTAICDRIMLAVKAVGRFDDGDISVTWVLDHFFDYLQVTPREKLIIPKLAKQAEPDVAQLIAETTSGHALCALGPGRKPIRTDLDNKAPHIGISMPTGEGKTNTIMGIIAQEMHLGGVVWILDYKQHSHQWAKGLEGIRYCRSIEAIHEALVRVARIAMRRNEKIAAGEWDDPDPDFQRLLVVIEEVNTTRTMLRRHWAQVREPSDPKISPAEDALEALLNMGRAVRVHIMACFQRLSARAAGGPENRDQYGLVILAAPKKAVWKMFAEDVPYPNIHKDRGRNWFVHKGRADEAQQILWTRKQGREWASSGIPSVLRAGSETPVSQGKPPARRAGGGPVLTVIDGGEQRELYGLRDASADKGAALIPESYGDLCGRRNDDRKFPAHEVEQGQKYLYTAESLVRWSKNREGADRRWAGFTPGARRQKDAG